MDCTNEKEVNNQLIKLITIRILLTFLIFYSKSINNWTKIILISSLDFIKNISFLFICGKNKLPTFSNNELYQKSDKILDTLSYYLIYYLVKSNQLLPEIFTKYLFYILLYRTVGVVYYLFTNDRKIFVYFVDLFKEALLLFYLFSFTFLKSISVEIKTVLILFLVIIKLYIEYRFHYTKDGILIFKNK